MIRRMYRKAPTNKIALPNKTVLKQNDNIMIYKHLDTKIFFKGKKIAKRATVYIRPNAFEALEVLHKKSGKSYSEIITHAAEQFLLNQAVLGNVGVPKGEEETFEAICDEFGLKAGNGGGSKREKPAAR